MDLHDAKDVKDVVESEDAVVDGHQAAEPRGGGHQQQHKGVSNGGAVETHRGSCGRERLIVHTMRQE